jgi:diguanylate cyclase (GGDEF)-like protein
MHSLDTATEKLISQTEENRVTNPRLVLEAARTLRDTAKETKNNQLLGYADYCMVNAYFVLNDVDSVSHYALRALPNLIAAQDWYRAGNTYNIMALAEIRVGNMAQALEYLSLAIKMVNDHSLYQLGAMVYLNAADVCTQLENTKEAFHNILIAETFVDKCEEGDEKDFNEMVASSEGAVAARKMKDQEAYQKQKDILNALLKKHPDYENETNVLMLEYSEAHDQNDSKTEDELIQKIETGFYRSAEFLNYINEFMYFLVILKDTKNYHALDEMLEFFNQSLNGYESVGIMTRVSLFKVKYYMDIHEEEKLNEELRLYWQYSQKLQKQTNDVLISLIDANNNLEETKRSNELLKTLADTDSLTSLPNRRAMNEKLDLLFEQCYHEKHSLGVEMLDVDNFKHVNDTYGHSTGDDVLVLLGKCLKEITGPQIYAARYGGDEFVILFDNLKDEEIMQVNEVLKEKIKQGIESASLPVFTISQGATAKIPVEDNKAWDFTSTADAALYVSKRSGKDQYLMVHSPSELKKPTANSYIAEPKQ